MLSTFFCAEASLAIGCLAVFYKTCNLNLLPASAPMKPCWFNIQTNNIRKNMKKILVIALGLLCASAIVVQAQDAKPKHKMTDEQKALLKELTAKYDTNKDGKLDKTERAAMSQEDKDKLAKAGLTHAKKKAADATAPAAPAADATK